MFNLPIFDRSSRLRPTWDDHMRTHLVMRTLVKDIRHAAAQSKDHPRLLPILSELRKPKDLCNTWPYFSVTPAIERDHYKNAELQIGIHWPGFIRSACVRRFVEENPSITFIMSAMKGVFSSYVPLLGNLIPRFLGSVHHDDKLGTFPLSNREHHLLSFYMERLSNDTKFLFILKKTFDAYMNDGALYITAAEDTLRRHQHYSLDQRTFEMTFPHTSVITWISYPAGVENISAADLKYPRDAYNAVPYGVSPFTFLASLGQTLPMSANVDWFQYLGLDQTYPGATKVAATFPHTNKDARAEGLYLDLDKKVLYVNLEKAPAGLFMSGPFREFAKTRLKVDYEADNTVFYGKFLTLARETALELVDGMLKFFRGTLYESRQGIMSSSISEKDLAPWGRPDDWGPVTLCLDLVETAGKLRHVVKTMYRADGARHQRKTRAKATGKKRKPPKPRHFVEAVYSNPCYIERDGLRTFDDSGKPIPVYMCYYYGNTYYNVGLYEGFDPRRLRVTTRKDRAQSSASLGAPADHHWRWMDGVMPTPDPAYPGFFFTYDALYKVLTGMDIDYDELLGINDKGEFIQWMQSWRFSTKEMFMKYWKRHNPQANVRSNSWSKEEDDAIIELMRPGMSQNDRALLQRICKRRSDGAIAMRAAHLREIMIKQGVLELEKLPHRNHSTKLVTRLNKLINERDELYASLHLQGTPGSTNPHGRAVEGHEEQHQRIFGTHEPHGPGIDE